MMSLLRMQFFLDVTKLLIDKTSNLIAMTSHPYGLLNLTKYFFYATNQTPII